MCLLYIMMRIPFWIARPVLSPFGAVPRPPRGAVRVHRRRPVPRPARCCSGTAGAGGAAGRGGAGGPGRAGGRPPGRPGGARAATGGTAPAAGRRDRQHPLGPAAAAGHAVAPAQAPAPAARPVRPAPVIAAAAVTAARPAPAAGGPGRRERVPAAAAARHAGPAGHGRASSPSPWTRRPGASPAPARNPGRQPLMAYDVTDPVPIPADVEMPDKVLAGLTARQVAIAAAAAAVLWLGWMAARHVMPLPAFAALAAPVALAAIALVIVERDGLPLDRLLAAAWRQARSPRRLVTAPEGIPAPPAWAPARPGRRPRRRRRCRRCGWTSRPTG